MGLIIYAHAKEGPHRRACRKGENVVRILAAISAEPIDPLDREFEKF